MVVGQALHLMVKGIQPRRRQGTGLAHAAADHLAQTPRLGDQRRGAAQHRANRRAQALGQAHRHRIEMLGDLPRVHVEPDRRVVEPRAVQVQGQAMFTGKRTCPGQVLQRQHLALHGVLQRQQAGAGEVKIIGLDRFQHLIQVQGTVRLHFQWLRLDRTQHRRAAAFVLIGVGLLTDDVFFAALTVGHQRQQVAHGAGGHEQRRGEPQALGQFGLQAVDAGVFAIHVIAADGAGHRIEHAGGGLGHGVAAQVYHGHQTGL